MPLITRQGKGSKLTIQEMDGNLEYLDSKSTGSNGTSGVSGSSGRSGTSGVSGSSGRSGTSGANGSSGSSGANGSSGSSGRSGTSGVSGSSGSSGANGSSGSSGRSGTSGANGSSGSSGNGTSGVSGEIYWNYITNNTTITTLSTTDVVIGDLSMVLSAGTYKVEFNAEYDAIQGNVVYIAGINLDTLYADLTGLTVSSTHALVFGSGEILSPGVYYVEGAASVAGTLTFDGQGDSNSLFVIRSNGAFNTGAGVVMNIINGADPANIFWVAVGAIGIGADNVLFGNLISFGSAVAVGATTTFVGRLFSTNGACSFGSGNMSKPLNESIINMGLLSKFFAYTKSGAVSNGGVTQITGDIGTALGAVTLYAGSTLDGSIYTDAQPFGETAVFSVYGNGILVPNSERTRSYDGIGLVALPTDVTLIAIVAVGEGESIDIRYRTDIGQVSVTNRIMIVSKLHV
jgi:hypothetical protein